MVARVQQRLSVRRNCSRHLPLPTRLPQVVSLSTRLLQRLEAARPARHPSRSTIRLSVSLTCPRRPYRRAKTTTPALPLPAPASSPATATSGMIPPPPPPPSHP